MLSYIEACFRMILSFITGLDGGGGGEGPNASCQFKFALLVSFQLIGCFIIN